MIVTDLTDRERKQLSEKADLLADSVHKLAAALRSGDDTQTLMYLILATITGSFMNDLIDTFHKAAGVEIPNDASPLTPPSVPRSPLLNDHHRKEN